MIKVSKLVDSSALKGKTKVSCINTKKLLFEVLQNYMLNDLFDEDTTEDEKQFWIANTMFYIFRDKICFCSNIGTNYPIFGVNVKKTEEKESNILVESYKIDDYTSYTINKISRSLEDTKYMHKRIIFKVISPLEVFNMKDCINNSFDGSICVRTNFTKWNIIKVSVDRKALIKEEYKDFSDEDYIETSESE